MKPKKVVEFKLKMQECIDDAARSVDSSNRDLVAIYCIDDCFRITREYALETLRCIKSGESTLEETISLLEKKLKIKA